MATHAVVQTKLTGDGTGLDRALKHAGQTLRNFVTRAKASFLSFKGLLIGGLAFGFLRGALTEYQEQEKANAKLRAVLRSTGHAAGMAQSEMDAYADSLVKSSVYTKQAIVNAMALVATFKEIKGTNFKKAVQAILDISSVMDNDLKGASIQVGKALNDPTKGVAALSDVGVSFTQKQKDVIRALQETGRTAEAQGIIIKELASEFGGAAEEIANSSGRIERSMNGVKTSYARVGEAIEPASAALADFAAEIVGVAEESDDTMHSTQVALVGLVTTIKQIWRVIQVLLEGVVGLLIITVGLIQGIVVSVITFVYRVSKVVANTIGAIFQTMLDHAMASWETLKNLVTKGELAYNPREGSRFTMGEDTKAAMDSFHMPKYMSIWGDTLSGMMDKQVSTIWNAYSDDQKRFKSLQAQREAKRMADARGGADEDPYAPGYESGGSSGGKGFKSKFENLLALNRRIQSKAASIEGKKRHGEMLAGLEKVRAGEDLVAAAVKEVAAHTKETAEKLATLNTGLH